MKNKLLALFLISLMFLSDSVFSQDIEIPPDLISFKASLQPETVRPKEEVRAVIVGTLKKGWHIYSLVNENDAPILPTEVTWGKTLLEVKGPVYETNPVVLYDPVIETVVGYHEEEVKFYQNFRVPENLNPDVYTLSGSIRYQVCSDRICLLPKTESIEISYPVENLPQRTEFSFMNRAIDELPKDRDFLPGIDSLESALSQGIIPFILLAIAMGMLAWLTPCVFPMIPITVTFFSKQSQSSRQSLVGMALVFVLGIVATYTVVGLLVATLIGVSGVANLATSPWVNLMIAGLFTLFALSFMGLFELQIPSGVVQKVDAVSRGKSGYLSSLLMGTAFTLTAFTCTVQFVGTLLIAAAQGQKLWPIIGMLVFSSIFAFPFLLLALFPKFIKSMQNRSGRWMHKLKFSLGLIELMVVTKFLSNADLVWGWGILDREVVLTIWSLLLAGIGLVVLDIIPTGGGRNLRQLKQGLVAAIFFIFSLYAVWGVTGRYLDGWTESYLPPRLETNSRASLNTSKTQLRDEDLNWLDSLELGLNVAKMEKKPVFVDFTGYTCINCRWMEKNTFVDPEVYRRLQNDFVKVRLYTDGGSRQKENQELQIHRFRTIALPLYVILSPKNDVLAKTSGISNPDFFIRFLDSAHNKLLRNSVAENQ